MAESVDARALRSRLRGSGAGISDPFKTLKELSWLHNSGHEAANELLLRALERRSGFGEYEAGLNALVRAAGLYPYLQGIPASFADSIESEFHRPGGMPDAIVFHRPQFEIYIRLLAGENIILSAPTSFGKSLIVDAIIATEKYQNVAVVVPTLALIDETRRRLSKFPAYKVITHPSQEPEQRNIYVLTQERALAFDEVPKVDFFVIDEFYKLDTDGRDLDQRAVLLNQVFYQLLRQEAQFCLLGPNIERIAQNAEKKLKSTFVHETFQTVVSEEIKIPKGKGGKLARLINLCEGLDEQTLIYCASPNSVGKVTKGLLDADAGDRRPAMDDASRWIADEFLPEWTLVEAIRYGIGLHHGRLPRSLGQFLVRAFNKGDLRFLVCTSTLIEGVNTTAKNVVVYDHTIARKKLDFFTFNNIKGRSGRMFKHFVGRVYMFETPPSEELLTVEMPFLTQSDDVPSSLLLQLDESDLEPSSRARVDELRSQDVLPLSVLRQASGMVPEDLISLAEEIQENLGSLSFRLSWSGQPTYDQLRAACDLIWRHLAKGSSMSVRSPAQLAFKINQLSKRTPIRQMIESELSPPHEAASADEAVEKVLSFERNWASFRFPRFLRALDAVQRVVLRRGGYEPGDYSAYATRVEYLFRNPVLLALDEYGLPLPIAEKVESLLAIPDDLDRALDRIKTVNVRDLGLSAFEQALLVDFREAV